MASLVGTMRSAHDGNFADPARERRMASAFFGTPLDRRVSFTEPHGAWWWWLEVLWPSANFIHVWLDEGATP